MIEPQAGQSATSSASSGAGLVAPGFNVVMEQVRSLGLQATTVSSQVDELIGKITSQCLGVIGSSWQGIDATMLAPVVDQWGQAALQISGELSMIGELLAQTATGYDRVESEITGELTR